MKKLMIGFAVVMAMVASVAVFANSHDDNCCGHNHKAATPSCHMEGKHCSGSVGCDCPGFKPKTDGAEWEKNYCKYCGHKKSCHK